MDTSKKTNLDEFNHLKGVDLLMAAFEATELTGVITQISQPYKQGWRILQVDGAVKATGIIDPTIGVGDSVLFKGKYSTHPQYGEQFKFDSAVTLEPKTQLGMKAYLGKFSNVGPVIAEGILTKFGKKTFEVIEAEAAKLEQIPGISPARAKRIHDEYIEIKVDQEIDLYFTTHGLTANMVGKLVARYGTKQKAFKKIENDPYQLTDDVWGVGFKKADAIATSIGLTFDCGARVKAGLIYVMNELCKGEGHCLIDKDTLYRSAQKILGLPGGLKLIHAQASALYKSGRLIWDEGFYLPGLHAAEEAVATKLKLMLASGSSSNESVSTDSDKYDQDQAVAIQMALNHPVSIITGGPGTGKTYTILGILARLLTAGKVVRLAAPTGKAAKRMEAATGETAQTIHRLLGFDFGSGGFEYNEANLLHVDALIIDETSMIDIELMASLLAACKPECKLILVGDVDQLPSVGPGCVLKDVIDSEVVPVTRLMTLHRQATKSLIAKNAKLINAGQPLLLEHEGNKDLWFLQQEDPETCAKTILASCRKLHTANKIPLADIQVLAPMKKGPLGTIALNKALRPLLNPDSNAASKVPGTNLQLNDRVIQLKNNYDLQIFNGDIGYIKNYDDTAKAMTIEFEGENSILYPTTEWKELALAYALTIHKSQGSEFKVVVMPVHTQHYIMLKRNLLYTGVTRGKEKVILAGTKKALGIALRTQDTHKRNTQLETKLKGRQGENNGGS